MPPSFVERGPANGTRGEATTSDAVDPEDKFRKVPPHLKELCADSIIGSMKCLFRHDHPSESTKEERRHREGDQAPVGWVAGMS